MVGPPVDVVAADAPPLRVVVLGASNLALSMPTVVATLQAAFKGPLTILATPGHGRSYGLSTQFLWRRLPGIVTCGLWEEVTRQPNVPTVALLTDIGNDLAYEVPLARIVDWIETCLGRLSAVGARVALTSLPLESLGCMPPHRYRFLRRLLFPGNHTPLSVMLKQAEDLNREITRLARQGRGAVVNLPGAWYGLDPIHIRRSMRQAAWSSMVAAVTADASAFPLTSVTRSQRIRLRRLRPHERTMWGRIERHPQPGVRFDDGTTVGLY